MTLPDVDKPRESHYRDALATALKKESKEVRTEVSVKGGRADIVTDKYAIEVDKASKWHEAIGQACHYSLMLKLKPAIALYKIETLSPEQLNALKRTANKRKIDIINIKPRP